MTVMADRSQAGGLSTVGYDDDGVRSIGMEFPIIKDGVFQNFQMAIGQAHLIGAERSNGCAFADGPTRVTGVGFIRGHETDRIAAVVTELGRLGVGAEAEADGFVVRPRAIHGGEVATYDDHRMAMSFALVGLRVPGVEIDDPDCVNKTFPGFWEALDGLSAASL